LDKAVDKGLITRLEGVRLQKLRNARARARDEDSAIATHDVESTLEFSIQLVERYW
jgi:hypothetical protein